MAHMTETPELESAAEAAIRKGVHVGTVNRWVALGKLVPFREIQGKSRVVARLFRPEDVDAAAEKDGRRTA